MENPARLVVNTLALLAKFATYIWSWAKVSTVMHCSYLFPPSQQQDAEMDNENGASSCLLQCQDLTAFPSVASGNSSRA